jgi:hypothetical protein
MITNLNDFINEVRYINTNWPQIKFEKPISDTETIRVYHGFNRFEDAEKVLSVGLSGKEKARRIYSYESGNNPYGLFVSVRFDVVNRFAHGGVIIEFSTKISDLESPVWVGGRSYFVQGEYTKSFKDLDEREQQRLINRQKEGENPYEFISKSDRPELAATIFDNAEKQALYIGDLNPNMIKYIWYNEILHKNHRTNGEWVRYSRKDFIKKLKIDTKKEHFYVFKPNDDFSMKKLVDDIYSGNYNDPSLKYLLQRIMRDDDYELRMLNFFPKQIEQIKKLNKEGYFNQFIK